MIILPEDILSKRQKIISQWKSGGMATADACRRMLDLDPNDHIAWFHLGSAKAETDPAGAEELLWRSIEANPCQWQAYLELAEMLENQPGTEALGRGLAELGLRKLLLDAETLERIDDLPIPEWSYEDSDGEEDGEEDEEPDEDDDEEEDKDDEFEGLDKVAAIESHADMLLNKRDLESLETTARLRPYRLLHRVQEQSCLDREIVDVLASAGQPLVPLLLGALRAVVQGHVADEDDSLVENTLALLGEMAPASAIPELLGGLSLANTSVALCAGWAVDRIVSRDPVAAREVLRGAAPTLNSVDRMALVTLLARTPEMDPDGALIDAVAKNLETVDRETRELMFPILLAFCFSNGPSGAQLARSILRNNGHLVSRRRRAECEALIEGFSEAGALPLLPEREPPKWDVYSICAGKANWEPEESDADSGDDEDYHAPQQPVRREHLPGRNDPCWCGSGKKYKKCHLDADQERDRAGHSAAPDGEFDALRRRLGRFLDEVAAPAEGMNAYCEMAGRLPSEADQPDVLAVTDWLIHDWTPPGLQCRVMDEFLRRHGASLRPRERELVESWSKSFVGLYEVQQVQTGAGFQLKDLISGKELYVHDVSLSRHLVRWDGLLTRVVEGERGLEATGVGLTVPRQHLQTFRGWLADDHRRSGLPWPEYFKQNLPRIRQRPAELARDWVEGLQLTNTDGERLCGAKAIYEILDAPSLVSVLDGEEQLSNEEKGKEYVWLKGSPSEEGRTVLGRLRLAGSVLEVETNSTERLERAKLLLNKIAGESVRHKRDEFVSQQEMKRKALETPKPERSEVKEMPPEAQELLHREKEKHYFSWPDRPLPALDGKTAREAVKSPAGREKVAELLRQFENDEERNRRDRRPFFNVERLRAELGLEEKGSAAGQSPLKKLQ